MQQKHTFPVWVWKFELNKKTKIQLFDLWESKPAETPPSACRYRQDFHSISKFLDHLQVSQICAAPGGVWLSNFKILLGYTAGHIYWLGIPSWWPRNGLNCCHICQNKQDPLPAIMFLMSILGTNNESNILFVIQISAKLHSDYFRKLMVSQLYCLRAGHYVATIG